MMNNYNHHKFGGEKLIYSQTLTVLPLKFGNGEVISPHTLQWTQLIIHAGINFNPC